MAFTPQDVIDEANSAYLNTTAFDVNKLFNIFKVEWRNIWTELVRNRSPFARQESAVAVVSSVNQIIIPLVGQRAIRLYERDSGSTDIEEISSNNWIPMLPKQFIPNIVPTTKLKYWIHDAQGVKVPAVTQNRSVLIHAVLVMGPTVALVSTSLDHDFLRPFMTARLAAVAAFTLGQNPNRAEGLNSIAEAEHAKLMSVTATMQQSVQLKRRDYRGYRGRIGRRYWIV